MTPRRLSLVHALLVTAGVLGPVATTYADHGRKHVLVLFGARRDAQLVLLIERNLPSLLNHGMTEGVDYYSEFIDAPSEFNDAPSEFIDAPKFDGYWTAYRDFLRLKYNAQHIDLIISVGRLAVEFMASHREMLFPGTPIVFHVPTPPNVRPANSTGLVNQIHFRNSLDLVVTLQPDLEHVFVVSGAGASDRTNERRARTEFLPLERRLDITYLSGLVTRDLEARLKTLPPRSAVFVVLVTKDGAGESFRQMDYLSWVASVANAPTYSWADASVDAGIVGGRRLNQLAETKAIATLALRVLQGARADDIPVSSVSLDVDQVDWRQLRRWGISEARVPAGTTVLFREPSMWGRYRRYIIGSLLLLLAQSALIGGLLVQRFKRRRAELDLRGSQARLRSSYNRIQHLSRRLMGAQEAERAHVARELHDDINQQLALLSIDLDSLRLDEERVDVADRLSEAWDKAHAISISVRDLSYRLHPEKLRLTGLVPAIKTLQRDLERPHQSIVFSHSDVPTVVPHVLALCMFRVVQEAISNAVKHSGARHVWVDLTGTSADLTLRITDDGRGFDVNGASSDGLGLISMGERVESVGGALEIHSTPGSGTRLRVTVPIHVVSTMASNPVVSAESKSNSLDIWKTEAGPSTSRDSGLRECMPESRFAFAGHEVSIDMPLLRILVVEDYAPFRHLICAALQQRTDFQTIEAADGLEAVQKAERLQPDLILLDINLPKLHGFEVAKQIRRLAPQARLLFLSQESSSDVVREAFRLGAHGYIQKHCAATDLLPAIDAVLAGRRFVSSNVALTELADDPAPHRHEILFCSDDAAIVDVLTRFIAAALNVADAAIVLVTESHRKHLLQGLRTQGVDIDGAIERGTYLSLDADEAPDPVRFLEAVSGVREAAAKAGKARPRVAFCLERAGRLWAEGRTAEAVQLEQLCSELAHDVDILCAYPLPYQKDDEALKRICAEHTAVSFPVTAGT